MSAAWSNTISAVLTDNAFFADLAAAVSNDGSPDGAARWLIASLDNGRGPIATYDAHITAIEAIVATWPVVALAAEMFNTPSPALARFVAERIPAALQDKMSANWCAPVTAALVLADRAHDLAGLFSAGLKPNGSKDPYALRRAAKHFIVSSIALRISQGATR